MKDQRRTINHCVREAEQALREISATARLDAELLLAEVLQVERHELLVIREKILDEQSLLKFQALLERRKSGEPIAYVLGEKEFYSLKFKVCRQVLVPRPETEHLVELAYLAAKNFQEPLRILDIGTGSGCIAIALARELSKIGKDFHLIAIDNSIDALHVAALNMQTHGMSSRISLLASDLLSALIPNLGKFQIVLSNPPYVSSGQEGLPKELSYEPAQALFAGSEGLEIINKLLQQVPSFLAPAGVFFCEIGSCQADELMRGNSMLPLSFHEDLAGYPRILELRRN